MRRSFFALFVCSVLAFICCGGQVSNEHSASSQDAAVKPTPKKVIQIDWHAELAKLERQLARDPHSAFLHSQAATAYDGLDDFPNFEREIDLAMDLDKKSAAYCYDAYAVYKRRKMEEKATQALNRALQIDPNNPLGHYERAAILESEQKWADALTEYEVTKRLLEAVKQNADGLNYSRWSYVDPRGAPYDVTYLKERVEDDILRSRTAASGAK